MAQKKITYLTASARRPINADEAAKVVKYNTCVLLSVVTIRKVFLYMFIEAVT